MRAEHIPTDAYRLLREIAVKKKVRIDTRNPDDSAAVGFLLTRGLAKKTDDGEHLEMTDEGAGVGRLLHSSR